MRTGTSSPSPSRSCTPPRCGRRHCWRWPSIWPAVRLPKTSSVLVRPCHQHQPCRRIRSGISTAGWLAVLLRLAYLGLTNTFALLRLLPMTDRDKDTEVLVLRHQITVLQRQLSDTRVRFSPTDRALLAALLHRLPRQALHRLRLLVRPDTILRWHRDLMRRRHARVSRPNRVPLEKSSPQVKPHTGCRWRRLQARSCWTSSGDADEVRGVRPWRSCRVSMTCGDDFSSGTGLDRLAVSRALGSRLHLPKSSSVLA
jgi:hypothetical protein